MDSASFRRQSFREHSGHDEEVPSIASDEDVDFFQEQLVSDKRKGLLFEKSDQEALGAIRDTIYANMTEQENESCIQNVIAKQKAWFAEAEEVTIVFRKDGRKPTAEEIKLIVANGALLGDKSGYGLFIHELESGHVHDYEKRLAALEKKAEELRAQKELLFSKMNEQSQAGNGHGFVGKIIRFFGGGGK
ncbi:MAG: hypothetical protein COU30_00470 [Candidatus Magasanikbacteria bacterium CG10_big_fil_rev_8_21_14_0_10_38_6]|uniref:Uncharacterized protein n=1 Tax=Candidatus Magasanikbacteria bacterium CG10_big_fil_rev_8_21_14_0_10_38_6 TaxID=1974647 RepID=A0A2M6P2P2_9BACT|nr:MAG: hypothetical protein COU30_00470 [Candidatus Magasanikbacteria bacterium CG10_big_fil_rev_8_21_14_0_10_38_6]